MAVVAEPALENLKKPNLKLGIQAISRRPWALIFVALGAVSGWLLHPEWKASGLARSFALPPLDVYADAAARSRGWGVFIATLLIRWAALLLFVLILIRKVPRPKGLTASLGIYALAAISYAIPLNIGLTFVTYSTEETSMVPAVMVLLTPVALVVLTRFFTYWFLRSLLDVANVGWLVPVLSVGIWTLANSLLDGVRLSSLSVLAALAFVSVQAILLAALVQRKN